MDIGSLTGAIEIEDQLSSHLTVISRRVSDFADSFDGAMGAIAISVGVATAAVVGITSAVLALGDKGSVILGVEESFDRLARGARSTGDALFEGLSAGVRATVDSMELMQTTSRALSAGVKLNADDMKLLGETARAMGKATGTDAARGLDTLSNALATGRVRGLQMAGITVNLRKEQERLALAYGVSVKDLSTMQRLEASRNAILDVARSYVDRLGVSELNLRERIKQTRVALGNWLDDLSKAVAKSYHVTAAYDAIASAIKRAFGMDSERFLTKIVEWINYFADQAAMYGPKIIETIAAIKNKVVEVYNAVQDAWDLVPEWFKRIATDAALAGAAVGAVHIATGGVTAPQIIDNIGSLAATWGVLGSKITVAAAAVKTFTFELKVFYEFAGVAGILKSLAASLAAVAATKVAIVGMFVALGAAIYEVGGAVLNLERHLREGGSLWEFLSQRDEDNWVRRWLGLSTGVDKATESFKELIALRGELEATMRAGVGRGSPDDFIGPEWDEEAIEQRMKLAREWQNFIREREIENEANRIVAHEATIALQTKTFTTLRGLHGDNVLEWIKEEERKAAAVIYQAQKAGQATAEWLAAERADHAATIEAGVQGRLRQITTSRAYFQMEYEEAKNKLDLMLDNVTEFVAQDIRLARGAVEEKLRQLNHWSAAANDALDEVARQSEETAATGVLAGPGSAAMANAEAGIRHYGDVARSTLSEIGATADNVAEHVWRISHSATMALEMLSEAEFRALGGERRLQQIEDSYRQFPGRRAGATGPTGNVTEADWRRMLEEQVIYQKLLNFLERYGGQEPAPRTRAGRPEDLREEEEGAAVGRGAGRGTGKPRREERYVFEKGAIVMNYPIIKDARSLDELFNVFDEAFRRRQDKRGERF